MKGFCQYKHMFGEVHKGIHSYRVFDLAIMDFIQTFIGAFVLSWLSGYDFVSMCCFLFALGIVCHRIFCVRTTVDTWLFP